MRPFVRGVFKAGLTCFVEAFSGNAGAAIAEKIFNREKPEPCECKKEKAESE